MQRLKMNKLYNPDTGQKINKTQNKLKRAQTI